MTFPVGATHTLSAAYVGSNWVLYLDETEFGYYPASLWSNQFTTAGFVHWFGEVYSGSSAPITAMGNGRFGQNPISGVLDQNAATIQNMKITLSGGQTLSADPALCSSNLVYYNINQISTNSMAFGGPGAASAKAYDPTYMISQIPSCGCYWIGSTNITALEVFDGNSVSYSIPTTSNGVVPEETSLSPDGSTLFVLGEEEQQQFPFPQVLLVIDTASMSVLDMIQNTPVPSRGLAIEPSGQTAYLAHAAYPNGQIFPLTQGSSRSSWTLGTAIDISPIPEGMTLSGDGSLLFVTGVNFGTTNENMTIIKTKTNQVLTPAIPISQTDDVERVVMRPDQSGVYVMGDSNITDFSVSVSLTGAVTYTKKTIPWKGSSLLPDMAFSPDSSRLYVLSGPACVGIQCTLVVSAINPDTGVLIAQSGLTNPINLPTSQSADATIAMSADGSTLFAAIICTSRDSKTTNCNADTVYQISTATGKIVSTTTVPGYDGDSMLWDNWSGGRADVKRIAMHRSRISAVSHRFSAN